MLTIKKIENNKNVLIKYYSIGKQIITNKNVLLNFKNIRFSRNIRIME